MSARWPSADGRGGGRLLELRGFSLEFPGFRLGPLSIAFRAGERVALLGTNGAGKTTTLEALGGRLHGYGGRILLEGSDLRDVLPGARARIGFLPERFRGFAETTVREHLRFLSGFFPTWDRRYERELTRRLELPRERPLGALSRGMRVKLGIVAAEAHRPPVLLLDEPFSGLDPVMRDELRSLLDGCAPRGGERVVLCSSHLLEDVGRLSDRIVLLEGGRLRLDAGREQLRERFPRLSLSSTLHGLLGRAPGSEARRDA